MVKEQDEDEVRFLSTEMIAHMASVFRYFDFSNRGRLDERGVRQACAALGFRPEHVPEEEVTLDKFVLLVDQCIEQQDEASRLQQLFRLIDTTHSGAFDAHDVARFLKATKDKMPSTGMLQDLCDLIGSGDGTVTYPEFARHIKHGLS